MRINSVNSVNQKQQRNQNFGMAVKTTHPDLVRAFFAPLAEKSVEVTQLASTLERVVGEQASNPNIDVVFLHQNYNDICLGIVRQSDGKALSIISPWDKAYAETTPVMTKASMLLDASRRANTFSEIEKATISIATTEK